MLIKLALTLIGIKMEEGEGGGIGGVPLRWSRDWVTHAITGRIWKHTRDLYRSLSATPESQACTSDSLARHVELWLTPPPPTHPPEPRRHTHPRQRLLFVQCILGFEGGLTCAVCQEGTSWRQKQAVKDGAAVQPGRVHKVRVDGAAAPRNLI